MSVTHYPLPKGLYGDSTAPLEKSGPLCPTPKLFIGYSNLSHTCWSAQSLGSSHVVYKVCKAMCHTMECKRDRFNGVLDGARETH